MLTSLDIDYVISEMKVSAAFLNADGIIVEVSEGWKQLADTTGMPLPNYGIGKNYLRYCINQDRQSVEIIRGLQAVLAGRMDCFSTIYPCGAPGEVAWFLLAAFASSPQKALVAVVHFDITQLLQKTEDPSIAMVGVGDAAAEHLQFGISKFVRRAIGEAMENRGLIQSERKHFDVSEQKRIGLLNRQQLAILGYLARGLSNAQIAKAHSISLSAAKAQSAAVIRKLGLANRSQAALFAVRNGIQSD